MTDYDPKATTALTPPPAMLEQYLADAGEGVSFRSEDQQISLARVLQSNSPQVNARGPEVIKEAQPGDWWLRNAIKPIRDGKVGIEVVPCRMQHSVVEWRDKRQGFVARHLTAPDDVEHRMIRDDSGRERPALVRQSNGNIIQESRDFFLLFEGAPYLLPCTSTFHSFAREWNSYFTQIKYPPVTGEVLPSYSRRYLLRTVPAANALGHWFKPQFQDLGWTTDQAEYQAAKALSDIVRRGIARVETPLDDSAVAAARVESLATTSASASRQAPGVA